MTKKEQIIKREYKLEQVAGEIAQVAIVESSAIGIPNDHIEPWVKDFAIGVAVATAKWADSHPNWISVEDELPDLTIDGWRSENVFFATNDGKSHFGFYSNKGVWFSSVYGFNGHQVTHWMPLPVPPQGKEG